MEFRWHMIESEWKRMIKEHVDKDDNDRNYYGAVECGALRIEFMHTKDMTDWYLYTNIFAYGIDVGYGELPDGTPYNNIGFDDIKIPENAKNFNDFKKIIEDEIKFKCGINNEWRQYSEKIFKDWN